MILSTLKIVLGVVRKAGILDENDDFLDMKKALLVDAIDICIGAMASCDYDFCRILFEDETVRLYWIESFRGRIVCHLLFLGFSFHL
jgi:hypothetical protein